MNQKNALVIEQFRANNGIVTVVPPRGPVLLLHTWGRKTGAERVTPLMYLQDGDRQVIFASMGGWRRNPDWYHNLVADPNVTVEVGTEVYNAIAVEVHGEERERLYDTMAAQFSQFALYKKKTKRLIPVIFLQRKAAASDHPSSV